MVKINQNNNQKWLKWSKTTKAISSKMVKMITFAVLPLFCSFFFAIMEELAAFSLACFDAWSWLALQMPLMSSSISEECLTWLNSSRLGKAPWEWLRNFRFSDCLSSLFLNLFFNCFVMEDLRYLSSWAGATKAALILDFNVLKLLFKLK